ncbi:Hypothetical predicted protein [Paramuricea clavata]|uniref:Uncharacterized protein n=1 Tax=Paramuricea clavata TaxID=317549 RepID=A0A6S7FZA4_PARCT|nr:Hypothetical predicted protein [Paramuricea clavata]
MALSINAVIDQLNDEMFAFEASGITSDEEEDLDRCLAIDEEPADEEDDDDFEVDDKDPNWKEDGDLGEGSGGRGRSPIRRRADSPNGTSGNRGRGSRGRGRSGREAGVEGLGIPGPTLIVVNLMMQTLGIPSLPFNQAVRQEFILIGMSCGEE